MLPDKVFIIHILNVGKRDVFDFSTDDQYLMFITTKKIPISLWMTVICGKIRWRKENIKSAQSLRFELE